MRLSFVYLKIGGLGHGRCDDDKYGKDGRKALYDI